MEGVSIEEVQRQGRILVGALVLAAGGKVRITTDIIAQVDATGLDIERRIEPNGDVVWTAKPSVAAAL